MNAKLDLIEEYLKAVAVLLPKAQRDDIVAELRDMILTRVEAREEELGRPLTDDEVEAVLREIGHPLVVAARYGEGPQHVVGPMLYPYWLFGVKVALAIQAFAAVITFITVSLASGDVAYGLGRAVASGIAGAATLIGLATAAAWVIERQGIHISYLDRWRVKDLHVFGMAAGGWGAMEEQMRAAARRERPRRARSSYDGPRYDGPRPPYAPRRPHGSPAHRGVALIVWGCILAFWWLGGLRILGAHGVADLRGMGIDPGPLAGADWGAVKAALFGAVLAYVLMTVAQGAMLVAWPRSLRLHGVLDMLTGAALLALVAWLWNAAPLAPAVQVDSLADFGAHMAGAFDHGPPFGLPAILTLLLAFTAFGAACRIVAGLFQTLLPSTGRADSAPPPMGGSRAGF